MKRVWLYAGLAASLAGLASLAVRADPRRGGGEPYAADADAMPPYEVMTTVRGLGFNPITQPTRRGNYYVLHAYDARGVEVRVIADAQFGDIVSVGPAAAASQAYAPQPQNYNYSSSPRIIQVPDNARASREPQVYTRTAPRDVRPRKPEPAYGRNTTAPDLNDEDLSQHDDADSLPAQPQQQLPPLRKRRVLERPDAGLSPLYPTGRWRARVEEFGQPPAKRPADTNIDVNTTGPDNPPIGYTPPKVSGTIRMIEPARPGEPARGTEPTLSKEEPVQASQPAQATAEPAKADADPVAQTIEPSEQSAEPAAQGDDQPPQSETRDTK